MKSNTGKDANQPVMGPHHCAALGHNMIGLVFMTLQHEAKRRNGRLTIDDLRQLEQDFRGANKDLFDVFSRSYNSCMESFHGRHEAKFERRDLLVFVERAYCGELVRTVFANQLHFGGARWKTEFLEFLGDLLRQRCVSDIDAQLYEIYCDLALWKGQELSAGEIAFDPRVSDLVHRALRAVRRQQEDGGLTAAELCETFNRRLSCWLVGRDAHLGEATEQQMERFLTGLIGLQIAGRDRSGEPDAEVQPREEEEEEEEEVQPREEVA